MKKERLWNYQTGLPSVNAVYGLVVLPLFTLAVFFEVLQLESVSTTLLNVSAAVSISYTANLGAYAIYLRVSRWFSNRLKRAISSEIDAHKEKFNRRIDDINKELETLPVLTKDEIEIMRILLRNAKERVQHGRTGT